MCTFQSTTCKTQFHFIIVYRIAKSKKNTAILKTRTTNKNEIEMKSRHADNRVSSSNDPLTQWHPCIQIDILAAIYAYRQTPDAAARIIGSL